MYFAIKEYICQEIKTPKFSKTFWASAVANVPGPGVSINLNFINEKVAFIIGHHIWFSRGAASAAAVLFTDVFGQPFFTVAGLAGTGPNGLFPFNHIFTGGQIFVNASSDINFSIMYQKVYSNE